VTLTDGKIIPNKGSRDVHSTAHTRARVELLLIKWAPQVKLTRKGCPLPSKLNHLMRTKSW